MLSGEKNIPTVLWTLQNQKNCESVKPPAWTLRSSFQLRRMSSEAHILLTHTKQLWAVCTAQGIRNNSLFPPHLTMKWLTFTLFVLPDISACWDKKCWWGNQTQHLCFVCVFTSFHLHMNYSYEATDPLFLFIQLSDEKVKSSASVGMLQCFFYTQLYIYIYVLSEVIADWLGEVQHYGIDGSYC